MLEDKIKICFDESSDIDLLSLPFKSSYRILSWHGASDNTVLTPDFNIIDVAGKFMVIKSFKIVPYYQADSVDMFVDDGAGTVFQETIPATARIDRVFDIYGSGTNITLLINGGQVNLFNAVFNLDLDLQNIYFKYPEKIQTLQLQILATVFDDINAQTTDNADLKVYMEVYLI
jgi:hypothetical protein